MAGHSHSANIKYRKDRQDNARSQLFLKVRKKIEIIIQEEGEVNEKSLSVARENKFPKERVYQIWEKLKNNKETTSSLSFLYQAPFSIMVYLESQDGVLDNLEKRLKLKKLPLTLLPNYFKMYYGLKVNWKKPFENFEDYLFDHLPAEVWEEIDYNEVEKEFNCARSAQIAKLKDIITQNDLEIVIEAERTFWKPLISCLLTEKEELTYYEELTKQLADSNFYTNVSVNYPCLQK